MKKLQEDGAAAMYRPDSYTLVLSGPKKYLDEMQKISAAIWVDIYKPIKKGKN